MCTSRSYSVDKGSCCLLSASSGGMRRLEAFFLLEFRGCGSNKRFSGDSNWLSPLVWIVLIRIGSV